MYEITILSIFRDSANYLERYLAQVESAIQYARSAHLIWVEGDSVDSTPARLEAASERVNADVTLVNFNHGGPYFPSIDHPQRWAQLESCWNQALSHLEPTEVAVCVESDLIWDWWTMAQQIVNLEVCQVSAPMLWGFGNTHFYDSNAFRRNGGHFQPYPPIIPDLDEPYPALVDCSTVGGMVVATGEAMAKATWKNKCVLHFPEGVRVCADTRRRIYHP